MLFRAISGPRPKTPAGAAESRQMSWKWIEPLIAEGQRAARPCEGRTRPGRSLRSRQQRDAAPEPERMGRYIPPRFDSHALIEPAAAKTSLAGQAGKVQQVPAQ
jgi:hypothetical protein